MLALQATLYLIGFAFTQNFLECPPCERNLAMLYSALMLLFGMADFYYIVRCCLSEFKVTKKYTLYIFCNRKHLQLWQSTNSHIFLLLFCISINILFMRKIFTLNSSVPICLNSFRAHWFSNKLHLLPAL